MSRQLQFSLALALLGTIGGAFCCGWYIEGPLAAIGCAMVAFWSLATMLAVVNLRRGRRELRTGRAVLVPATRNSELRVLPLHLVEAALVAAPALFLLLGDTPLEIIMGMSLLLPIFLKVFVFVRSWSMLPPH
ncbi:MAG TPA: hypothetical protein VG125_28325 [Pirellulales bacterium]|jgi:hypothetical protein|nr:hypothetical protein [Pirellulales bacterium]